MTVVLKATKQIAIDDLFGDLNATASRSLRDTKPDRSFTCVWQGLRCALAQTIMDTVTLSCLTIAIFHCRSSMCSCMNSTAELRDWLMIAVAW